MVRIQQDEFIVTDERAIISDRLSDLLDDMLAGRAPNAGRFCGNCYHPLANDRTVCPHCGIAVADEPTAAAVPSEIIEAFRLRRGREGLVVRTFAWSGLTLGVVVALLPLAFVGVTWWTFASFFILMFGFYVLSANLANSVGDTLGYRWGTSIFRKRWDKYKAAHAGVPAASKSG
ncbi:MAG: hypothetical protein ABI559_09350 [Chloroflexota bacterium]